MFIEIVNSVIRLATIVMDAIENNIPDDQLEEKALAEIKKIRDWAKTAEASDRALFPDSTTADSVDQENGNE